jgi:hypothetical protein
MRREPEANVLYERTWRILRSTGATGCVDSWNRYGGRLVPTIVGGIGRHLAMRYVSGFHWLIGFPKDHGIFGRSTPERLAPDYTVLDS